MQSQISNSIELTQDQQDVLRSLLDSELVLVGGGEAIGLLS